MKPIVLSSLLVGFLAGFVIGPTWADDEPAKKAALAPKVTERSTDDLIQDLGHLDYATRESATLALIEQGSKARTALEKALESEDVEVRMRAGRALRSIGAKENARRKAAPKASVPSVIDAC